MNNALSFDIEDWFQVENLKSAIAREQWDTAELRVEASTRRILALLREAGAHATFFILGWVAERCPALVADIDRAGHEVASHGYGHGLVYDMTPEAFREDLLKSKRILEGIVKKPVIGYRAPSFSITPRNLWALDVLKEAGFEYDSSIFPVSLHDRYHGSRLRHAALRLAERAGPGSRWRSIAGRAVASGRGRGVLPPVPVRVLPADLRAPQPA
jgi:polysaccharide deacetylase family protein (PEP-CTERM system associated)